MSGGRESGGVEGGRKRREDSRGGFSSAARPSLVGRTRGTRSGFAGRSRRRARRRGGGDACTHPTMDDQRSETLSAFEVTTLRDRVTRRGGGGRERDERERVEGGRDARERARARGRGGGDDARAGRWGRAHLFPAGIATRPAVAGISPRLSPELGGTPRSSRPRRRGRARWWRARMRERSRRAHHKNWWARAQIFLDRVLHTRSFYSSTVYSVR